MKEFLKKLRWKWHRDITEDSLGVISAKLEDLENLLSSGQLEMIAAKLDDLKEICTEVGSLVKVVSNGPVKTEEDGEPCFYVSKDVRKEWSRLIELMKDIGTIPERALQNAKICSNRKDILSAMPKNAICAEVGVAYGDFSRCILDIMHPSIFYAIDYFGGEQGGHDIWGRTALADSGLSHFQWYKQKFEKDVEIGKMEVLQGLSWEVLDRFPDQYFDYIYLDACHSFDSVSKDVEVIRRKIKQGGIIAFNDYTLYNFWTPCTALDAYYGVVPVANQLIKETNSEVLFMGLEPALSNDLVVRYLG